MRRHGRVGAAERDRIAAVRTAGAGVRQIAREAGGPLHGQPLLIFA